MSFCGIRAQFGDGSVTTKLRNQRPKFFVQSFPQQFDRDQFIGACLESFGRWSAVCDVIFAPTNDQSAAQFVIFTHQFDGPSGILADCEFPGPVQQAIRIDPAERWNQQIQLIPVLTHEMGHGLGIPHFDPAVPPPELMNPVYNPAIDRPQSGEISFVQKLYGLPQTATEPTPVTPIGDSVDLHIVLQKMATGYGVDMDFKLPDGKYQAKGTAKRVA